MADQRDHDLRLELDALLRDVRRGLEDRPRLHDVDLGEEQSQAAAAQAKHRVRLAHRRDGLEQLALLLQLFLVLAGVFESRHLDEQLLVARQELVQRRIDQADDDRVAVASLGVAHGAEDALEVAALEWQQLIERLLAFREVRREDHALDDRQALLLHEHVLGAAEADALRAEGDGALRVARVVRVGPDAERARLVGPAEQRPQVVLFLEVRLDRGDCALVDRASRAVDGDLVALFDDRGRCRESRTGASRSPHGSPRSRPPPAGRGRAPPPPRGCPCRRDSSGCPSPPACRGRRRGWSPGARG